MNNINKITLEYLLNQNKFDKINNIKNSNLSINDFKNYKSEIIEITNDMFDNNFINNEIKEIFITYCKNLIYQINNKNFKKTMQEEYINYKPKEKINITYDSSINNIKINDSFSNKTNKTNKSINLDKFVIKNKPKNNKKILPKKKIQNNN